MTGLTELAKEAKGCDLYRNATQTVFGNGARAAALMLVGEQPGDQEDKAGKPFVGPAGRLLDKALTAADIDRKQVYLTNAVKHFQVRTTGQAPHSQGAEPHRGRRLSAVAACRNQHPRTKSSYCSEQQPQSHCWAAVFG